MKKSFLNRVNAVLQVLIAGLIGVSFGACATKYGIDEPIPETYGIPTPTLEVSGVITDQENHPLKNIRVEIKNPGFETLVYTDKDGQYYDGLFLRPQKYVDIVVDDTAGVFAHDSVRATVVYEQEQDDFGTVIQDFQLKKKEQ